MIRSLALGSCLACVVTAAEALPIEYLYVGAATGDVLSDATGALLDSLDGFPFDYRILADTDDVFADSGVLVAPGTGLLSLDGSPFVEEDDTVFAVVDPVVGLVGALDIVGAGFVNDTPAPALVGYDLVSDFGPLAGLESGDFVSEEILNAIYGEPVTFDGAVLFSFEARLAPEAAIPAPPALALLGGALLTAGLWRRLAPRETA